MRSFHYLTLLIALGDFASVVQSAPLPLEIGQVFGHDDLNNHNPRPLTLDEQTHMQNIRIAAADAHQQVVNMQNLLNGPHADAHPHLVNAFGENYNKQHIKNTADLLVAGTIHVGNVNKPNVGVDARNTATTVGYNDPNAARINFHTQFHEMNPASRAGTIIHEATHALDNTRDLFSADPKTPNKFMPLHPADKEKKIAAGHDVKSGYHHDAGTGELRKDFIDLKEKAGNVMHKNADSYKVLAHTATHGLGTLPPAPFPPVHAKKPCPPGQKGSNCNIL